MFLLLFRLVLCREVSAPHRKQVIVIVFFRAKQGLQNLFSPNLLPSHPSVPQSFIALFPLTQAVQISLLCKACVAPHPQVTAYQMYSVPVARKSFLAHSVQCVRGNIPLHSGHFGTVPGTTNVFAANSPQPSHIGWFAFFGWGTTRYGFSTADIKLLMCFSSCHTAAVGSAAVGVGSSSSSSVNSPMRSSTSVALSILVPTAAASSSVARVVLLILPALHPQLMVAMVGSSRRRSGGMRVCGDGGGVQACGGGMRRRVAGRQSQRVQPMVSVNCLRLSQETRLCIKNLRR